MPSGGGTLTRLTRSEGWDVEPAWSPPEEIKNDLYRREKCNMMSARARDMLKSGQFRHVVIAGRWAFYAEATAYDNGKMRVEPLQHRRRGSQSQPLS
ncbi:MAG: hypothetical protein HC794_10165 [Nitrospiraceae bacterium]|nr:hypothetical protein [Nitrospiraceae bacterium]